MPISDANRAMPIAAEIGIMMPVADINRAMLVAQAGF